MCLCFNADFSSPTDIDTLSVKVEPDADCTTESYKPKLNLKLQSLYSGEENSTNMVILNIKMLSGFVPDAESLKSLQNALLVNRLEPKEDRVLLYIRELPKDTAVNHSLELVQEVPVQSLKPAVVQIYDYYQPSKADTLTSHTTLNTSTETSAHDDTTVFSAAVQKMRSMS
ncbi:pregnancy zone protein-like [Channa argus]|uniref:pregnancy zone protein-like n=1 Tax=Channa argus TaxID=215402 RepID=UPI003521FA30